MYILKICMTVSVLNVSSMEIRYVRGYFVHLLIGCASLIAPEQYKTRTALEDTK